LFSANFSTRRKYDNHLKTCKGNAIKDAGSHSRIERVMGLGDLRENDF